MIKPNKNKKYNESYVDFFICIYLIQIKSHGPPPLYSQMKGGGKGVVPSASDVVATPASPVAVESEAF